MEFLEIESEALAFVLLALAGGLTILFFGRRLFWLYIGLLGVLVGFELSQEYFPGVPQWGALLAAIVLGVVMAVLAILLQYVAIALAGLVGGAYLGLQLISIFPAVDVAALPAWVFLIPGVLGALVCLLLFNPALIVLSSLTGAAILAQLFPLPTLVENLAFFILAVTGIVFQSVIYSRGDKD